MEKFNIDDEVVYLLDQINQYKVVAIKTKPRIRENLSNAEVPADFDYLIVQINRGNEFGIFIPVKESHLLIVNV